MNSKNTQKRVEMRVVNNPSEKCSGKNVPPIWASFGIFFLLRFLGRFFLRPGRPDMSARFGVGKMACGFNMGVEPKIGVSQNRWFIMETPIKMDDLGVPLFVETPTWNLKN